MFLEFKQKIVKDYTFFTSILLMAISLSIYVTSFYMSYKAQLSHIEMLAIEESEDLLYKLNDNGLKNLSIKEELTTEDEGYFARIFVYGFDIRHDVVFEHNTLEWSKSFMEKAIPKVD